MTSQAILAYRRFSIPLLVSDNERSLLQLLERLGGLGMPILLEVASEHFESSKKITAPLVTLMILQGDALPDDSYVKILKLEEKTKREEKLKIKAAATLVLNKKEFRNVRNLRYGKDLKGLPSKCHCGQSFNMTR